MGELVKELVQLSHWPQPENPDSEWLKKGAVRKRGENNPIQESTVGELGWREI